MAVRRKAGSESASPFAGPDNRYLDDCSRIAVGFCESDIVGACKCKLKP